MKTNKWGALLLERISDKDLDGIGWKRTLEAPDGEYQKHGDWYYFDATVVVKTNKAKPKLETCPFCGEDTVITRSCAKVKYCNDDNCFYWEHF